MLINKYQVLDLINTLTKSMDIIFEAEEQEEWNRVRLMWHSLFVSACRADTSRLLLLDICQRCMFPVRSERDTEFLKNIGALDSQAEGLDRGFARLLNRVYKAKGKPAKVFNIMIASRIYYDCFIEPSFDWGLVKVCPQCGKVFKKEDRKQRYCEKKCSNKKRQRPYDPTKDGERAKINSRVRWLSKDKGHSLEAIKKQLQEDYGEGVLDRYKVDKWKAKWNEKMRKFEYWREEK